MKLLATVFALALTPLFASATEGSGTTLFAKGAAEVSLPAGLSVVENDDTLVAEFGPSRDHLLMLSYNPVPEGSPESVSGIGFVRESARNKGVSVMKGPDRVSFMEFGGDHVKNGTTFRVVHWQIGVKEGVFVLTVRAPMPMSPSLSGFIDAGLNQVVSSVAARQ